jgi:hypothetical protein
MSLAYDLVILLIVVIINAIRLLLVYYERCPVSL